MRFKETSFVSYRKYVPENVAEITIGRASGNMIRYSYSYEEFLSNETVKQQLAEKIKASGEKLRPDILKVAHHGSAYSRW